MVFPCLLMNQKLYKGEFYGNYFDNGKEVSKARLADVYYSLIPDGIAHNNVLEAKFRCFD